MTKSLIEQELEKYITDIPKGTRIKDENGDIYVCFKTHKVVAIKRIITTIQTANKEFEKRIDEASYSVCVGCQDCANEFNSACDMADHCRNFETKIDPEKAKQIHKEIYGGTEDGKGN